MDLDNAAKLKIFSAEHRQLVKIAADSGLCTSPVARAVAISAVCGPEQQPKVLGHFRNAATTAGFYCPTLEMAQHGVRLAITLLLKPDLKTGSSRIANFFECLWVNVLPHFMNADC